MVAECRRRGEEMVEEGWRNGGGVAYMSDGAVLRE